MSATLDDRKLLLAIDTSRNQGSVALARFSSASFELVSSSQVEGGMFSAQLAKLGIGSAMDHSFSTG